MAHEEGLSTAVDQLTAASNDANEADIESANLRPAPVSDQPVHDRFPDVHAQAYSFLEKIKSRFGPNSRQSVAIHNKLGEFLAGEISKRDTYFKILDELQNNEDLKGDFQAILHHEDAQWAPLDFQPETSAVNTHVSPDFLQPDHRPSLPMPTVSTFWSTAGYCDRPVQLTQPSINPELLHNELEMSYPINREYRPQMYHAAPEALSNSYTSQNTDHSEFVEHGETTGYPRSSAYTSPSTLTAANTYYNFNELHPNSLPTHNHEQALTFSGSINSPYDQESGMGSTTHQITSYPQHSFSLSEAWRRAQYGNAAAHTQKLEAYYNTLKTTSPEMSDHESFLQLASPEESTSIPVPSVISTPKVEPSPRFIHNALPLEESFKHESLAYFGVSERHNNDLETMNQRDIATESKPIPLPVTLVSTQTHPTPEPANLNLKSSRLKGEFIHSLCGKTFTTRHGVKKHHWGPKIDDKATTMGCWAKSGKPDVEWDDHPSCRDNCSTERVSRRRPSQTQQAPFKMPTAPSMIVNQRSPLPAIPTLENLPNIVAESLYSTPTAPHFPTYGEIISYHTAHLPGHGNHGDHKNFETLLKVVNVASSIEAPTPESRNDSVVSQLEAKTASTELRGRYTPSWLETPCVYEYDASNKVPYQNPNTGATRLGITETDHQPYGGDEDMGFPLCQSQKVDDEPTLASTIGENRDIHTPNGESKLICEHPGRDTLVQDDRKRLRSPYFGISKIEHQGFEPSSSPERKQKRQRA